MPIGLDEPYRVYISEDPIGLAGGDVNLYVMVGNNPVNFTDPLGLTVIVPGEPLAGCPPGVNCVDPGPQLPPKDYPFPRQPGVRPPAQFPYTPPIYEATKRRTKKTNFRASMQ